MRDPLSVSRLADIIDQARGKAPADLVIKSVGIFDLTSGEVTVGDIAIAGDRIVGTHQTYHGATEIDGRGLVAVPGFIDSRSTPSAAHAHAVDVLWVSPAGRGGVAVPKRENVVFPPPKIFLQLPARA